MPVQAETRAQMVWRKACISCHGSDLEIIGSGSSEDEPLRSFLHDHPIEQSARAALADIQWRLVECTACKTRFHGLVLDPAWQSRLYDVWMSEEAIRTFEEREGWHQFHHRFADGRRWLGHVLSIEKMTREDRVGDLKILDFGCGAGSFLAHAAQLGAQSYGVDASPGRRSIAERPNVQIVRELSDLPSSLRGTFDAVTLFEVLEHLVEPHGALKELREWIRPGGILVLETPNAGHIDAITTKSEYLAVHPFEHINAFSPASLTGIARNAGFHPVHRQYGYTSSCLAETIRGELRKVREMLGPKRTQQYFRAV